jgi:DNA sulfur modification protein DndD
MLDETNDLSDASAEISRFDADIDRLESEVTTFWRDLDEMESNIKKVNAEIEKRRVKIGDIDGRLKGLKLEKVTRWQERLKAAENEKDEWSKKIGASEDRISHLRDEEKGAAQELDDELKKTTRGLELKKKIDFLDEAISISEGVRDNITSETKGEVARLTNENFFSFLSKKTAFEKVEITDEYEVNVVHALGWQARNFLSTGETQMLALAFFAALHKVSGLDMPIFIDAPLARISEAPTERIVEAFPKCFENKQVCLLMLDKEYRPVRDKFVPIVGHEYQIMYNEEDGGYGASVVNEYA